MRRLKIILPAIFLICILADILCAAEYSSRHFVLREARVIISAGQASSLNYILLNVEIGNMFGGRAESASYSLDTEFIDVKRGPNAPKHRPFKDPTNIPVQPLCGTKDRATSIYIDGYEAIPLDNYRDWDLDMYLCEGLNSLIMTSRDKEGMESESVFVSVTLDTIPPAIIIDGPACGSVLIEQRVDVNGTIDGKPFCRHKNLKKGSNIVAIEASDEAGNKSAEEIKVYRAHKPIKPGI